MSNHPARGGVDIYTEARRKVLLLASSGLVLVDMDLWVYWHCAKLDDTRIIWHGVPWCPSCGVLRLAGGGA